MGNFVGNYEKGIALRPRPKWENIIKINKKILRIWGVDLIHLAQGMGQWRGLVNMVPYNAMIS